VENSLAEMLAVVLFCVCTGLAEVGKQGLPDLVVLVGIYEEAELVVLGSDGEQSWTGGFEDFEKVFFERSLLVQEGSRSCKARGRKFGLSGSHRRLERGLPSIASGERPSIRLDWLRGQTGRPRSFRVH